MPVDYGLNFHTAPRNELAICVSNALPTTILTPPPPNPPDERQWLQTRFGSSTSRGRISNLLMLLASDWKSGVDPPSQGTLISVFLTVNRFPARILEPEYPYLWLKYQTPLLQSKSPIRGAPTSVTIVAGLGTVGCNRSLPSNKEMQLSTQEPIDEIEELHEIIIVE